MKKILHILPHLGGGVGQVLGNIALESKRCSLFENEFILIDSIGDESQININKYSLSVFSIDQIEHRIKKADIVQLDWWNHPTMAKLLVNYHLPPCRIIVYAHISGIHYPNIIPRTIINFCDKFVASTKYTLENHSWIKESINNTLHGKVSSIHSCAGLSRIAHVQKKAHSNFNVGYIGSLDFTKLHPDYVAMSAAAHIPQGQFIICGKGNDSEAIIHQIKQTNRASAFHLLGYVEDIAPILSIYDVFGYPLNPLHYGTGEQVLIETQGAGIPAIVLNNGPESVIIRHEYNGMVVNSAEEYSRCLEFLAGHPDLVDTLGENARNYSRKEFTLHNILRQFNELYEEMIKSTPCKLHEPVRSVFQNPQGDFIYFLNSIEDNIQYYIDSIDSHSIQATLIADKWIGHYNVDFTSSSKGTIFQYYKYFNNDSYLAFWCGLIMLENKNYFNALSYFQAAKQRAFQHWRIDWYILICSVMLDQVSNASILSSDLWKRIQMFSKELSQAFGASITNKILRISYEFC